ncbi:unnamed protein product [Paramecium primaurelia]|uniref:Uncharacterized protein n=1 Tax=Paramecium primaurelia TaxID=5886 RepID=A0A8S1KMP2_PARPR|nr:unnamed protein product [Paramecium primaurelia]
MNSFSPASKISKLIPLNLLQKQAVDDEEPMFLERSTKKIKFNELLIVLNYHPNTEVTYIKRQVLKCKGLSNVAWLNPCINEQSTQNSQKNRSILKRTDN